MEINEINKLAMRLQPMPDNLSMSEEMLFLNIRNLAYQHKNGFISKEQASVEKFNVINSFKILNLNEKIADNYRAVRNVISQIMIEANKNGCDICKKMTKVLDGREQII